MQSSLTGASKEDAHARLHQAAGTPALTALEVTKYG